MSITTKTFVIENPTSDVFPWTASLLKHEKWINRARGEKLYKTLFFHKYKRGMRYSRKNHRTATDALNYAAKFRETTARLEGLGYFKEVAHDLQQSGNNSV